MIFRQIPVEYWLVMRDSVSKLSQSIQPLLHCPSLAARNPLE